MIAFAGVLVPAFLLDLAIGDPVYPYHPARLMGNAIAKLEEVLRPAIRNEKLAGGILAVGFPFFVFGLVWILISFLRKIHPGLGWAAEVYGIYVSLSVHDLRKEALRIYADLGNGDLEKARLDLARIVGRDTQTLEKKEILRASIETVAESTVDGVIAPLFFAALGGAPLALAYKAVNTLDSMIGHLNERYKDFGFLAAKSDEIWNWIPARISYYMIALASFFVNGRPQEALFAGWQDGMSGCSSNGDIPEASFAGALGVQLGGPSAYQGRLVQKPLLGFPKKDFDREDLLKSIHLMVASSWLSLFAVILLRGGLDLAGKILKF